MANRGNIQGEQGRLAVLIDADNAQPSVIEGLLAEIAKFGVASVKRIYGDWTSPSLKQWKNSLLTHSITPVQQFAYTKGKNATDISLVIDAMDLMYTRRFDGFCLVSSDSDFTRLAQRLREEGMTVYGFGEKKTPDAFVSACDKFVYTEVLRAQSVPAKDIEPAARSKSRVEPKAAKAGAGSSVTAPPAQSELANSAGSDSGKFPIALVRDAIEDAAEDDAGWVHLSIVGSYLTKVRPNFDPRLYGHKKLSDLLRKYPKAFELQERGAAGASSKPVYVRVAKSSTP